MYLEETPVEADLMEFHASDDYAAAMEILASDETRPRAVAEARDVDIGINVAWYGGKDHVDGAFFLNQIKGATGWLVPAVPDAPLEFDENGYVTALPDGMSIISTILNRDPHLTEIAPFSGTFRIYGQGEGTIYASHEVHGDLIDGVHTTQMAT